MKAFYVSGTHWDREWYEPFQEYRRWLVDLIDDAMDVLEAHPEYKCFHLDAQTSVLQDYLEIRPERRERLLKLLKDRRLLAGPWYTLPDEWLVSGEGMVRNLMRGVRDCTGLGFEPMRFFYTPDQFGQTAGMPIIANGFGFDAGIVWRGTQDETWPNFAVWVGPDGSRMVVHKRPDAQSYTGPRGGAMDRIQAAGGLTPENIRAEFDPHIVWPEGQDTAPLRLILDAFDHQPITPNMVELLPEVDKAYDDVDVRWASLEEFGDAMRAHAEGLPEHHGDVYLPARAPDSAPNYLIVHTLSSRYPLKQSHDRSQAMLEKWAEPYALFEAMGGGEPITRNLFKAWEYLLLCQPHDSICGCSIDQVHRDVMYRLDQARMLGEGVVRRAFQRVCRASSHDEAFRNFAVHNPLPYRRKGLVELALPLQGLPVYKEGLATSELAFKFHLVDKSGKRLPYQISRIERGALYKRLGENGRRRQHLRADLYHVAVEMELPPCGYSAFRVEPTGDTTRNFGTMRTGAMKAANSFYELEVHPDGTATLTAGGRRFSGLFTYEDCGDSGDGWTRGVLHNDIVYRSPGSRVTTAIEEDGHLRTVFRIERELELPRRMEAGYNRSDDRVTLRVVDRLYVEKGSPCVRVRTTVHNTVKDHRLRVLFPTEIGADRSFADGPFCWVERDIDIPEETAMWREKVNPEKPFSTWCGVRDDEGGLAVLSPGGLHEYEVTETPERSLALTLFRATWKTVATSGEPDGELQQTMDFSYCLYPFRGEFDAVVAAQLVGQEQAAPDWHGVMELPDDHSFVLPRHDACVVSAIKPASDGPGGVIRLWNPADEPREEVLDLSVPVATAELCNLNEVPQGPATVAPDGGIQVTVPPRGFTTVRFTWKDTEHADGPSDREKHRHWGVEGF